MKNLLAAVALFTAAVPCSAAESAFELRGAGKDAPAVSRPDANVSTPSPTGAAPIRKVRIVLGSPYGN